MLPIESLSNSLYSNGVARFMAHFAKLFPDIHMKDLTVDVAGPGREVTIDGHKVINFGCDSFLGLDRDPRVWDSLKKGIDRWGSHNGASRMFNSVRSNVDAENKIAEWLGTEASVIYPSVTLANAGVIPGLVTKGDVIVCDEFAHNSIQEGIKIAKANGTRSFVFKHNNLQDLERKLEEAKPYKHALITIDGVYSMSGSLPKLKEMHALALKHNAILYVDDAHGTGVMGKHGRGTVMDNLGHYENTLVIGSLSKAFSCMGGFVGCPKSMQDLLKIRSNSYIFGGPVAPCYLDAICTVIDILQSDEYEQLQDKLNENLSTLVSGAQDLGLIVLGGHTPIISILVEDEANCLRAGKMLFDLGCYVQSVAFPAVPYRAAVLRIQVNANHDLAQIRNLVAALGEVQKVIELPNVRAKLAA
ncbi:pyridoxal phosphate-dependent aminotransferase family protein [Telmatocola sphagniphila]|uniref:Pyridoxal phosphate-dependent aminotransferase family protein n=1 Tax=Telmatocola sphagniphila TaxID=1123043 RepID=A0A8E6BAG2_9BACT|nr:pyridoxal phosphate-dependent aminotransferase family protein [Telmatocola sphagniphila]QVL34753.1 pyridoxal phosphate-dependent aminotransferase family protein [Telmatocola sphagniphila]